MTKQEVSQRVLLNGKPLSEDLFMWDEETKTFSSKKDGLVLDFKNISDCTFDTGYNCTFKTGSDCTFDTGSDCTFKTGSYCTFKTGYNCTFKTGYNCTFDTGSNCVIIRRDIFEVIVNPTTEIKLCPYEIKGYLTKEGDKWLKDGLEHIIIDGILSKVISHKGNVYKVINHNESNESYIATDGVNYSHGETLKEAKESLIYKISDRDTSAFKDLTIDSVITFDEAIKMYRKITGACEGGVKGFISTLPEVKEKYSIKEVIELTKGRYNNQMLVDFFNK